jgi:hypothetical protein
MCDDHRVRVVGWVVATWVVLASGVVQPHVAQAVINICIPKYGPCISSSQCCSDRVCRSNICLDSTPTCQSEGAPCTSSSQCCGSRVCQNLFCRTPVGAGDACGPAVPCSSGLVCAVPQFTCRHTPPQFGEPCSALVPCAGGLACTALTTFVCVHSPAREGEHCDATAHCGDGLFCQAGTQTCVRYRTAGEGCSAVNPCLSGLACQACFVSSCAHPLECFPSPDAGPLTDEQCRALYSPDLQQAAKNAQVTMTYGGGTALSAGVSTSSEIGAAYGQDGRFGCYQTICAGINVDVSIGDFAALGFYDSFDSVGGSSFATAQDVGGEVFSFSTSQIASYLGGPLIGTEDAFGIGASAVPFPFHAGVYQCQTFLNTALGSPDATPTSTATPQPPGSPTPTPVAGGCIGDCNGDGQVTIVDLVAGVNIALGNVALPACRSFDRDGNGEVDISEIIGAVRDALDGCPPI